jgi:hypothetical protein
MKHFASPSFWECYEKLPIDIKNLAEKNFKILKKSLYHPSLHFKKVNYYWSVRVGTRYRALAVEIQEDLLWFWIGTHAEYDKLLEK